MTQRIWILLAAMLVLASLLVGASGRGGLAYFSPYTLQYYTQSECTVIGTGIPIYRSEFTRVDSPLLKMLVDEGFVEKQADHPKKWEQVYHWNDAWRGGYGSHYRLLKRERSVNIQWSLDNREAARLYWAEAFRLLRSDNEIDVRIGRELLNQFPRTNDAEQMQREIERLKMNVRTLMRE